MAARSGGSTRPPAGHKAGNSLANKHTAPTDVPPPNGPGLRPDAPTTWEPGPPPQTAAKTSRDLSISTAAAVVCSAASSCLSPFGAEREPAPMNRTGEARNPDLAPAWI